MCLGGSAGSLGALWRHFSAFWGASWGTEEMDEQLGTRLLVPTRKRFNEHVGRDYLLRAIDLATWTRLPSRSE